MTPYLYYFYAAKIYNWLLKILILLENTMTSATREQCADVNTKNAVHKWRKSSNKTGKGRKRWGAKRILREFPNKQWSRTAVKMLLQKIDQTSSVSRRLGSGRPRCVRSEPNIQLITDLICSQENAPGTGKSPREIEKETWISRSSVRRIEWPEGKDLALLGETKPETDRPCHWPVETSTAGCHQSQRRAHWADVSLSFKFLNSFIWIPTDSSYDDNASFHCFQYFGYIRLTSIYWWLSRDKIATKVWFYCKWIAASDLILFH